MDESQPARAAANQSQALLASAKQKGTSLAAKA